MGWYDPIGEFFDIKTAKGKALVYEPSFRHDAGAMMKANLNIRKLILACTIAVVVSTTGSGTLANNWPAIQPMHERHTFADPTGKSDTPLLISIKDGAGVPVYKLECHNGNYDDDSEFDFSGDFQCVLFAVKGKTLTSGDLLAANTKDEQSTDWWNRGRMLSHQLRGECLAYPEYSINRHFRLRGTLITLRYTNMEWSLDRDQQNNPLLEKFTLNIDVVPDESAQSSTAEEPKGPKPPSSCYP